MKFDWICDFQFRRIYLNWKIVPVILDLVCVLSKCKRDRVFSSLFNIYSLRSWLLIKPIGVSRFLYYYPGDWSSPWCTQASYAESGFYCLFIAKSCGSRYYLDRTWLHIFCTILPAAWLKPSAEIWAKGIIPTISCPPPFWKTEKIGTFFRTAEDRTKVSSQPMKSATSSVK